MLDVETGQTVLIVPFEAAVTVSKADDNYLTVELDKPLPLLNYLLYVVASRQSSKVAQQNEQHVTLCADLS